MCWILLTATTIAVRRIQHENWPIGVATWFGDRGTQVSSSAWPAVSPPLTVSKMRLFSTVAMHWRWIRNMPLHGVCWRHCGMTQFAKLDYSEFRDLNCIGSIDQMNFMCRISQDLWLAGFCLPSRLISSTALQTGCVRAVTMSFLSHPWRILLALAVTQKRSAHS